MTTRLSGPKTFFLPYNRDLENPPVETGYRSKYLWEEVLTPSSLLDVIENFIHLSKEDELYFDVKSQSIKKKTKDVLIFPRYHQLDLIRNFRSQLREDGVGKNYLVQHTTGSGKSYSIGWLSHTLTSFYESEGDTKRMFDTIIVVTDRQVLDEQLGKLIRSLQKDKGIVHTTRDGGSKELKDLLEKGKDIVITTIQKFPFISETISSLGDRKFGVIIDEVHSSQSGELSKELKKSLSKSDDDDEFDYEEMLRQEIQSRGKQDHISFFGFTGTPKEKTLELFGTKTPEGQFVPFHIYSMYQSIHEGFTLDVLQNYTTYKRYFKVKQTKDGDIEVPTGKGKRELIRYVDSHEMTIRNKVQIMLDHWIDKGSKEIQGRSRGMIVTQSRKHCVWYFKEINKQLEERGMTYKSLVGFSGEVSIDGEKFTESGCNKTIGHEGNVPFGLKNPQYRLLVVANKFQTGFDEPLIQSMYVDKKLGGVQCVQTLSRLNRTTTGKTQTFTLDFVNEPDEIRESFQRFYQSTILDGETDPNRLYDTQREIYDFHLYTHEDVNRFCEVFYDPDRDEGSLHPILDQIVDQFKSIGDEETREEFRSQIQSYIRLYGYLSQIVTFSDIELEKSFVFLKYLNKKLPKRETDRFDISDTIDLDSLRIQKIHEEMEGLERTDTVVEPPTFGGGDVVEPVLDLLSEIINQVNNTYGVNLTDDDKIDIERLRDRLVTDPEIIKYMNGQNTEDNKKNFFKEQFDGVMVDYINERFDFYKKMDENPSVKNHIFKMMYENYSDQRV
jgi:type I restriction enzyme R subunit